MQLMLVFVTCETYDSVGSDDSVHVRCCCPRIHAFQVCLIPANRTVSHRVFDALPACSVRRYLGCVRNGT